MRKGRRKAWMSGIKRETGENEMATSSWKGNKMMRGKTNEEQMIKVDSISETKKKLNQNFHLLNRRRRRWLIDAQVNNEYNRMITKK